MTFADIWPYIAIVLLVICSAYFSSSETTFATANGLRLKNAAKSGRLGDRLALYIYDNYERALVSILICNNLVNIAASSVATVIALHLIPGDSGTIVATAVMTVIIIIFGEILPKVISIQQTYTLAPKLSIPLRGIMIVLKPVALLVNWMTRGIMKVGAKNQNSGPAVTEDDLEIIIDTVEDEGVIDEDRCDLLQSALDFDEVQAYEIITPRVDMLAIDIDDDYDEILDAIMESPYTRIPVYEDSIDNIIGILHLNQALKALADEPDEEVDIRGLMMSVTFVHKTTDLPDVLSAMRTHQCHMVIVTDEYGGTMGVLTMEDVLEQLVGDIWDETDEIVDEFKKVGRDLYEADGDMRLEDFFDELDMDTRDMDDDNATVGGWAIDMLGGYPKVGDSFQYKNIEVTVKKRRNLRVVRLAVKVTPVEDGGDED